METKTEHSPDAARILVVEDDAPVQNQLAEGLRLDGHHVTTAGDAASAVRQLGRADFDLMLLDVNLPDRTGYDLLRDLRAKAPAGAGAMPVMMLSGRAAEHDRVRGFELGCDDYVVKPFSFTELRGRIAALLRRAAAAAPRDVRAVGALTIDHAARRVAVRGREVKLTAKEYALLLALAEEPERVFTRAELLKRVWGFRSAGSTRTLDAHACRLRAKLGTHGDRFVLNLWGVGYRLVERAEATR